MSLFMVHLSFVVARGVQFPPLSKPRLDWWLIEKDFRAFLESVTGFCA